MTVAPISPLFSYFGSKWRAVRRGCYPAPRFRTIIEPAAGSLSYALNFPDCNVQAWEKDHKIWSVWDYLLRESPEAVLRLPDFGEGQTTDDLVAPQEARWLAGLWINRCSARPKKTPTKAMLDAAPSNRSFWGPAVRQHIARSMPLIRHWRVHWGSWEGCPSDLIGEASWFLDFPYQHFGREYACGNKGMDYEALAGFARSLRGQVIVCENKGADWLPFAPLYDGPSCRGRGKDNQVVWFGPDHTAAQRLLPGL